MPIHVKTRCNEVQITGKWCDAAGTFTTALTPRWRSAVRNASGDGEQNAVGGTPSILARHS